MAQASQPICQWLKLDMSVRVFAHNYRKTDQIQECCFGFQNAFQWQQTFMCAIVYDNYVIGKRIPAKHTVDVLNVCSPIS